MQQSLLNCYPSFEAISIYEQLDPDLIGYATNESIKSFFGTQEDFPFKQLTQLEFIDACGGVG